MPTFTRAELHELVWAEPRVKLARRLGVSDVWIGKACVRSNIPVPGRGHWARLEAGQKISRTPLPKRGLGQADDVTLGPDRLHWRYRADPKIVVPPEPIFDEGIDAVRARAAMEVGVVNMPRGFQKTSTPVAAILVEEEVRRQEELNNRYAWKKPRFVVPAAVRRLKLVNALTLGLETIGYPSGVDADTLDFHVQVGDSGAPLKLSAVGNRRPAHHTNPLGLTDDKEERLQIAFAVTGLVVETLGPWQDLPDNPLENQLAAIATEILVRGEMGYRAGLIHRRNWAIEQVQAREADAREKQRLLEEAERERLASIKKTQLDHLLGLAKNLEQAQQIRSLVQAVRSRESEEPEIRNWCEWASGIAEAMDPRLAPATALFPPSATEPVQPRPPR
jgi:hypothetical protein